MSRRGNGEGSIVRRKDGRWMGVVTLGKNADGSPRRKSVYGKTRKEVAEKMTVILSELQSGGYKEPSKMPLGEWVLYWLDNYKVYSIKVSTYDSYRTNIKYHITPAIGHIPLAELRVDHIQTFVNQLYKNDKSSALIRKVTNILHGALEQAVANKLNQEDFNTQYSTNKKLDTFLDKSPLSSININGKEIQGNIQTRNPTIKQIAFDVNDIDDTDTKPFVLNFDKFHVILNLDGISLDVEANSDGNVLVDGKGVRR